MSEIRLPAIKIEQPIGTFYAVCIDSAELQKLSFSSRADYKKKDFLDGVLSLNSGSQRDLNSKRSKEIGRFINTEESTFPNSIILGANIDKDGNMIEDESIRWRIEQHNNNYELIIPSDKKVATIIDGQHRLAGFEYSNRKSMPLLCSVFIDLPAPYHAFIFATININQKKVDRSLAYELYGFRLEEESKDKWSPEKLAVYIARRANAHHSFLKNKIKLGASIDGAESYGIVSLAAVVDGILKLITNNPKADRDQLLNYKNKKGRAGLQENMQNTPLRKYYIQYNDKYIEDTVFLFFNVVYETLAKVQKDNSYLFKGIGFSALFNILKTYLINNNLILDTQVLTRELDKLKFIDFSDIFFTASGIGASRLKNVCFIKLGFKNIEDLKLHKDYKEYERIINS